MTRILSIVSFMLFAVAIASPPAYADSANAAVVLKDQDHPAGCFAFGLFTEDEIHTVSTSSGNVSLICHFNIPDGGEPAKAVRSTGFGCGIFLPSGSVSTTDTSFLMTPGGRATLICQVKGM